MFEELLDFDCECGRHHSLETRIYHVKSGARTRIPDGLKEIGASEPLLIYDANAYKAAGTLLEEVLPDADVLVLEGNPVHPDERQVETIQEALPGHDVLLAVGSGVICDLTRYAAFKNDLAFVAVPTAASADGFVSNSCAMSFGGAKVTLPAKAPDAVVCDLDIICEAPMRLTASGVGDMLSKYISIADWKIGHLSSGEYYCDRIANLELEALDLIVSEIDGIAKGEPKAMEALMKGLLLSGIAMQLSGITRPASSFEHHFSHYLEVVPLDSEFNTESLHGEKVGVATIYAAKYYPKFARALRRIFEENLENKFSLEHVKELFSRFPNHIVELVEKENDPTISRLLDPKLLEKNYPEIVSSADDIPAPEKLIQTLQKVGGLISYADLGLTADEFRETMQICCYIRNRYTMLRLVCDYDLYDFATIND